MKPRTRTLMQTLLALVMVSSVSAALAHDHDDDHWHDDHHDHGRHEGWYKDDHRGPPPPPRYHDDPRWHDRARWDRWSEARHHHFVDWRPGYVYQPGQWVWYQGRAYQARVPVVAANVAVPVAQPGAWLDISASIPLN
ncbi:hypothetical protein [Silvimonas iriomotensis]|uniref:Uncharacterized protein n=1 Tax=Silvimonas iriomotensis TaxID=449662 RepID=A0ABQ2PBR8_9NEIS|nr:hypothetical protein [Silvimonas iriomotensis]GGP22791.1 hypothetical protein GCM10010970_27910 [Silvimonas iriomotensis]